MNASYLSRKFPLSLAIVTVILTLWVMAVAAQETVQPTYQIQVNGLTCPFCSYGIEKHVSAIEGVVDVAMDLQAGLLTVTMKKGAVLDQTTANQAIEAAGFTPRSFHEITAASEK